MADLDALRNQMKKRKELKSSFSSQKTATTDSSDSNKSTNKALEELKGTVVEKLKTAGKDYLDNLKEQIKTKEETIKKIKTLQNSLNKVFPSVSYSDDSSDEIMRKVIRIISEVLMVDEGSVTLSATFVDLGADSLDTVDIIMKMEKEFNIKISDENAQRISTIGDAVNYIKKHH